ncbi:MAG: hypothetical protein VX777_04325 [Chlamydiota bacterium]|nr:hypothetical protein [Chlamydiota bacterium]
MLKLFNNLYYYKLLDSTSCSEWISPQESELIRRELNVAVDRYDMLQESYEEELESCNQESEDSILNEIESSTKYFRRQVKLVDTIFCLQIYSKKINPKINKKDQLTLFNKLIKSINSPGNKLTKTENKLLKQVKQWQTKTNELSYSSNTTEHKYTDLFDNVTEDAYRYVNDANKLHKHAPETINNTYFIPEKFCFHGLYFYPQKPVAVLKGCSIDSKKCQMREASSRLEQLMYYISRHLGLEHLFTKSGTIYLSTRTKTYSGSIQPFIDGINFLNALEKKCYNPLSTYSFTDAITASVIMGMYDLHCGNVILKVDEDNTKYITFFDNARSLPHSNGVFINSEGKLSPSYKNFLFIIKDSFTIIHESQRDRISFHIQNARSAYDYIEAELEEEKQEFDYPDNWINTSQIIEAMKIRVDALEKYYKKACSFIDLLFLVDPHFKYFISLIFANHYFNQDIKSVPSNAEEMSSLFCSMLNILWNIDLFHQVCVNFTISPVQVKNICNTTDTWQEWIARLAKYFDTKPILHTNVIAKEIKSMENLLYSIANKDFKDPERKTK